MKTATIFAVAVLSAGLLIVSGAQAAQTTDSSKTRQEVIAELAQARVDGEVPAYSSDVTSTYIAAHNQANVQVARKSRAEVVAELNPSRADGSLAARNADDGQTQAGQRSRVAAKLAKETNAE
ncbi:MAG TPA: DUF4148 domain-containing protein [Burkholderiaceae bacterium]|jgi:hypothetical protein